MTEEILDQKERLTQNSGGRTGKKGPADHRREHREDGADLENGTVCTGIASDNCTMNVTRFKDEKKPGKLCSDVTRKQDKLATGQNRFMGEDKNDKDEESKPRGNVKAGQNHTDRDTLMRGNMVEKSWQDGSVRNSTTNVLEESRKYDSSLKYEHIDTGQPLHNDRVARKKVKSECERNIEKGKHSQHETGEYDEHGSAETQTNISIPDDRKEEVDNPKLNISYLRKKLTNHRVSTRKKMYGDSIKGICCDVKKYVKQITAMVQEKIRNLPEEVIENLESLMISFQKMIAAMWKLLLCVLLLDELENLLGCSQNEHWNLSSKKSRMKYGFQMAAMLSLWLSHDVESNPGPKFQIRTCLEKITRSLSESLRYHLPVEGSLWSESVAEAAYAAGYSTDCQWNNPSGQIKDKLTPLIERATELGRLLTAMECLPEDLAPFVTNLEDAVVQEQLVDHFKVEFFKEAVNILLGVTSFSDAHKHVILQHTRSLQEKVSDIHNLSQRQINTEGGTSSDFGRLADKNAAQSSALIQIPSLVNTQTGQKFQRQSGQQLDTQNVSYIGSEAAVLDLDDLLKLFEDMQPQNQIGQNASNAEPPNTENTSSGSPQLNQQDELDSEERMESEESVYEQPAETNLEIMGLQQLMPGSDTDEERGRDLVYSKDWPTMMDTNATGLRIQGDDAEKMRDQDRSELRSKEDRNAVGNVTETELPNQKQPMPLEQIVSAQTDVQYSDHVEPEHESNNQETQEPPGDNCQNNEMVKSGEDATCLSHSTEDRSDSKPTCEGRTCLTSSSEDRAGSTPYCEERIVSTPSGEDRTGSTTNSEEMTVSTPSGEDRIRSTHNAEDRSESTPSAQETMASSPVNLGSSQHKPRSSFRVPSNDTVFTQQGEATISETKSDSEESEEENQSEDNAGEVEEEPGELPSSTERDTRRDGDVSGFEQIKASFWKTADSIICSWESFKRKDAGNETRAIHLKYVESITKNWETFQRRNANTVTKASYLKYVESIIKSWEMFSQREETSNPEPSFLKYVESTVDNFEVFRWSRNTTRHRYLQDRNGNERNIAHTYTSSDDTPRSADSQSRKRIKTSPPQYAKKRKE